ncbi:unnamed protein product, partial [Musa acuminata var. zebrina]
EPRRRRRPRSRRGGDRPHRRRSVASCPDRLRRGAGSRVRLPPPRGGAARGSPSTAGALRACCKAVLAAVLGADGGPACLCHLIRRPGLFGFPVNSSRIAALFSSCSAFGPPVAADSFTAFCRDLCFLVLCFSVLLSVSHYHPMFFAFWFWETLQKPELCRRVAATLALQRSLNSLSLPGSGDALTPPHDEPGRVSGPDVVVSHPTSASAQAPVCSLGGLLLVATVSFHLTGYICCY